MAEDSDLERTESATPKRIEQAREDGDVPRSRELATCSVLLVAVAGLWLTGDAISASLQSALRTLLGFERALAFAPDQLGLAIAAVLADVLLAFLPLALLLLAVIVAAPLAVGGWNLSHKAVLPRFSRLNPLQGIANLVSKNAAVELGKAIAKACLVALVAIWVIADDFDRLLALAGQPLPAASAEMTWLLLKSCLLIVAALVLIAAIDVPYQLWHYADRLKMTREQVRQEAKESDGNPEIKARIRQQQREIARRRMMAEIPQADVVITNPTHYAVAVKYRESGMRAPQVVAKGADAIALKIREIATEHRVPVLEAPKLARALHAHTELGDEIPQALYAAVAEVLAYVFQLRAYRSHGGLEPRPPQDIAVPDALDPHTGAEPPPAGAAA